MFLYQLPLRVDREYSVEGNAHFFIGVHILKPHKHLQHHQPKQRSSFHFWPVQPKTHCGSVAKRGVKGLRVWVEKLLYVRQTLDLELLWFFLNHLPVEGGKQAAGAEQHRAHGQHGSPLVHPVQVASGHVRHADSPRGAVHELVSIPVRGKQSAVRLFSVSLLSRFTVHSSHSQANFVVEASDTLVGPIFAQRGEDVTQGV